MTLSSYRSVRVRFTWQNRRVNDSAPPTSQKVLGECKNQLGQGGQCAYFGICNTLEAHQRIKTDQPCKAPLSWSDLKTKEAALTNVDANMRCVQRCLTVAQREGVCYEGMESEETVKIKEFEKINVRKPDMVASGVRKYLKVGPMLGTFEVFDDAFDLYGVTEAIDEIYVVHRKNGDDVKKWTHVVTITGFGVVATYPFWEFQNSYGPKWRGAARGFGQIYAIHLPFLYGIMLLW